MKLYYFPGACSLAPHIIAHELGLPLELVRVDPATKRAVDGQNYRAINPKGSVPALELDDGRVLTEGPAIDQFLADLVPDADLAPPAGTFERYRLQEWLNWVSTELHKGFGPLWASDMPAGVQRQTKDKLAERIGYLDRHLATSEYALGSFSVADVYAFVVLNWAQLFAIDLGRWPNVARYQARIAARPAVRAAMQAEGLIAEAA